MFILRTVLIGTLAFTLLGTLRAPASASAQTGNMTYDVTITNITNSKQGLSPVLVATHPGSVHAWQLGQLASKGLELLAEEGMPDMLAGELKGVATDVAMTHAHLLPGGDSITVRVMARPGDVLSAATMLIETNDGFTGLDSVPLVEGTTDTMAYDAGTEDNSELKTDVPGPPFGGKNHGPDSNPHQPISTHQGITGKADVPSDFNWTGPVARFTIHQVDPASLVPAPGVDTYDVTVTNINNSMQGLSPLVVATHPASVHAWQMGQLASKGLEMLAEEGMPAVLATELKGVATDVATTNAHLLPGDSITVRVTARPGDVLSAAAMLIQTNDGFTGLDSVPPSRANQDTIAYDAGTEDNSELAADVPGPPFGGKNHGPDSSPHQPISMHQGITGRGDVTPDFKWSGPVAHFSVQLVNASAGQMTGSGATAGSGSTPGMPATGAAGDVSMWLVASLAAIALVTGLTLRRSPAARRR